LQNNAPVHEQHEVTARDLPFEFMLNVLRLTEGFAVELFAERTGLSITAAGAALAEAEQRGLIERDHVHIRPTPLGRRFLNDLLELFLPGDAPAVQNAGVVIPIKRA
jgi:oxygen-independent coproporphyrinogen-3 oxidase